MPEPESFRLPASFRVEPELIDQLSSRPGHQRCIEGDGELLLVVHEVPQPGVPERTAMFFWKRRDGMWMHESGVGLGSLADLLGRYERAVDSHEEVVDEADTAEEIFSIIRHAAPLARSSRNLAAALEQVLEIDHDDRAILALRDRAKELERAAELLHHDARLQLEFWRAERAEEQANASEHLGRVASRLNLLAAFFLPLTALGALFGMNMKLPGDANYMFWPIFIGGLLFGLFVVYVIGWNLRVPRAWLKRLLPEKIKHGEE